MKPPRSLVVVLTGLALLNPASAQTDFSLQLRPRGQSVDLSWPSSVQTGQGPVDPEYTIERSYDLGSWAPVGGKVRAIPGRSGPVLDVPLDAHPGPVFYRVKADFSPAATQQTGTGGAEVFGFAAEFAAELQRLGFLSLEAFADSYPTPPCLSSITFDPTSARFWTNFNTNPADWNAGLPSNSSDRRLYDFRLNAAEKARFMTNGFVVSERLGSRSFGDAYYAIYTDDLPVFITSDSILQAWHRSYANLLREVEELQLARLTGELLTNMAGVLTHAWLDYGQGDLRQCVLDADFFLTVARSLWAGQALPAAIPGQPQTAKIQAALNAITALKAGEVSLFGRGTYGPYTGSRRVVDFSQFKVRGHYTLTEQLQRYFRTVMWLSRIDLRIGADDLKEDYVAQLGVALVLNDLLERSGQHETWARIETVTSAFVGPTDSLTFSGLGGLLEAEGLSSLSGLNWPALTNLQTRLMSGELGVQAIIGDVFFSPLSAEQVKLPRSFTFLGQKFVPDSWAFSRVVFDRILWPFERDGETRVDKVIRRKPSGVDAAFAVLGNDAARAVIASRILDPDGVSFRDGQPYQHNLAAARNVLDAVTPEWWTRNLYCSWLYALRALSGPLGHPGTPEAMRTHAWAMKTLNTQLASWTQLRHDTILYVKPSYTPPYLCDYPAGFVEPVPEFWRRMGLLAEVAADAVSKLALSGKVTVGPGMQVDLKEVQAAQLAFCTNFADRMNTLRHLSEKELASIPFTEADNYFVRSVVEWVNTYVEIRTFNGWYPRLFYRPVRSKYSMQFDEDDGCAKWDPLVTDVHTDLPDPIVGDPGAVIHQAVGDVNLLLIAVDNGPDRMVYAGPVLSYYEFEMPSDSRLTDAEWESKLTTAPPPLPSWTTPYLAPR